MIAVLHHYAYLLLICFDDVFNLNYIWMSLQLSESVHLIIQFSRKAIVQHILLNDFNCIFFPGIVINRHYIS